MLVARLANVTASALASAINGAPTTGRRRRVAILYATEEASKQSLTDEAILQPGFILLPSHSIHPERSFALQSAEAVPQQKRS